MEDRLVQIIGNGGWMAVGVVLGYLMKKLERRVERLEEKMDAMHDEFITKEDHYRDISGWRGEIHSGDQVVSDYRNRNRPLRGNHTRRRRCP